jgi:hypothetical protein
MVRFYKNASNSEIEEMEKYVSNGNWRGFKALIKRVIGIELEEGQNVQLGYAGDTKIFLGGKGWKDEDDEEE